MGLFGDKLVGLVEESSAFRVTEDDPFKSNVLELVEARGGCELSTVVREKRKLRLTRSLQCRLRKQVGERFVRQL